MNESTIQRDKLRGYLVIYLSQAFIYIIIFFVLYFIYKDKKYLYFASVVSPGIVIGCFAYFFIKRNDIKKSLMTFIISMTWGIGTGIMFLWVHQLGISIAIQIIFCLGIYFIEEKKYLFLFSIFMFVFNLFASYQLVTKNIVIKLTNTESYISLLAANSATLLLWFLIYAGKNQIQSLATVKAEKQSQAESITNLNAQIQHDLRNAMSSTSALSTIMASLADIKDNKEREEFVLAMLDDLIELGLQSRISINTIEELLSSLLYASRLNNKGLYSISLINILDVINNTIILFNIKLKEKRINVKIENKNPYMDYLIWADDKSIVSIISNLLENAIKYTEKFDTTIKITIWFEEYKIYFSVTDQGIGIPKDKISLITKKFERVYEKEPIKGFGIGLSIVKDYVEIHKGGLLCSSKEGVGTEFTIWFNYIPIPNNECNYETLLIDDDFNIHNKFARKSNHSIIHCMDIDFAKKQMNLHLEIRNFIIDINMNNKDVSIEFIDYIRRIFPNAKIIIHTVYNRKEVLLDTKELTFYKKSNLSVGQILSIL